MPGLPIHSGPQPDPVDATGPTRRRFRAYVVAGSTLTVGGQMGLSCPIPDAARPTNHVLPLTLERDGTGIVDLPRTEVGRGFTTAFAMVIADAMDMPLESVRVTIADARPELVFNQITGNSSSPYSLYEPVRAMATLARQRLADAAA